MARDLISLALRLEIDWLVPSWRRWAAVAPGSILFQQVHVTCGSDVFIVGDSHTLICGAHQAFPDCDVDARPGRGSTEALEILEDFLHDRHRVVVFEIATNDIMDPVGFAANLEELRRRVGGRKLVLVNTWRRDGVNNHTEVNRVLAEFADRHPGQMSLVDWAAFVDRHRKPLNRKTDHVHFTASAYEGRIALVAAAIAAARGRTAEGVTP